MRTIYKYPFDIFPTQFIPMPEGAKILTVQIQNGTPCLWAEIDDTARLVSRTIKVFGTGHVVPTLLLRYIGTIQMPPFVWHVYEEV